jgi:N-acetylmuramoyl-L-alanine amidase
LSWINRFIAPTGSRAAAAVLLLFAATAVPAFADAPLSVIYGAQTIRFTHVASRGGATAVGVDDPGFQTLLRSTGALLTWKPGERYVMITTSVPTVVSFAVGDLRYDVGPISLQARFAPYERGDEVFLPLDDVLGALDLALQQDGAVKILQPQLAALDVRQESDRVTVHAHGGAPMHARVVAQSASSVTYAFDGVGTPLSGTRQVGASGVRSIQVASSGSIRNPTTTVTVQFDPGTNVQAAQNTGNRDVELAFSANASAQSLAEASPTPEPAPGETAPANIGAANGPAQVTSVTAQPSASGIAVTIAVSGNADYEWHRLRDPDNRFWIDIKDAQLQGPPVDQAQPSPLVSMRVRQDDANTVRVALSLDGPKSITVTPSATGLVLDIGAEDVADAPRSGNGSIGGVLSSTEQAGALVTPAPLDNTGADAGSTGDSSWKFAPRSHYVPTNPRLIVIDPGHGGSDRGTVHGGVSEASLTLDMAKRLRDILVAQGWQVKLTHDTDVDVYQPNDSAHDELQARVDIANQAGARLFISIHANAFINSGPYGTTLYITKPDDVALARTIETHLESDGTKDEGVIKSNMYVTHHTRMPAVLIETAFLSNPNDYALLTSSAWRQKVAQEMADGIAQYAREYPVPNQPAQ